jgi:pimeloyl-ACP methyl ester carboxylesterase
MTASTATHLAPASEPAVASAVPAWATGQVISADGTRIGYRCVGGGPALVVVHGTMSSGRNHTQLAELLADTFTVYVPDRRGRGLSGPHRSDHGIATEIDDLVAVLRATGARMVFGVSSGGLIALNAALSPGGLDRVAVFEPPLVADAGWAGATLRRLDGELARGRVAAALVTAMRASGMGSRLFGLIPRRLLELLTSRYMAGQDRKGAGEYEPMRMLAPLLRYDFGLVAEVGGTVDRFASLDREVLLLGGSRSPTYLKTALADLDRVLPRVRRVELPGLDHAASWNTDVGGRPAPLAQALRSFLAAP